ncbi:D-alanine--D-alanyl carrier protein ligase [Streptomyces violaceorubidus]
MFPVRLDIGGADVEEALAGGAAAGQVVKAVKEQLLRIPDKGMGHGLLRYLNEETAAVLAGHPTGQIAFNYLGQFSAGTDMPEDLRGLGFTQTPGMNELIAVPDADMPVMSTLEINALVTESGRLTARVGFPTGVLSREEVRELADLWGTALTGLARHAARPDAGGLTPSDVLLAPVRQRDLERWEARFPSLTDVWPTTPLQQGLLFESEVSEATQDAYQMQFAYHLSGAVDPERMRAAGQALLDRYANLRTAFVPDGSGDLAQLVLDDVVLPWRHLDLTGAGEEEFQRLLAEDRVERFDPATPPLLRCTLVRRGPERAVLVLTAHHVLFDGWSVPTLMQDLLRLYGSGGDPSALPRVRSYRDFLVWQERQDRTASARAWADELAGFDEPTLLAREKDAGARVDDVGHVDVPLAPQLALDLSARAADLGVTLNTLVQGAWAVLLGQLTGSQDVVFGATVSGRPPAVPDVESMVGLFINTLPVRVRIAPGETFAELLAGLQARQGALLDHHHYGLTEIHRAVGTGTLFDTLVVFESYPVDHVGLSEANDTAGVAITGITPFSGTHYPVTVMADADPHLRLSLQYQPHALDRAAAQTLAGRLERVLHSLVTEPWGPVGTVDVLTPAERERVRGGAAATGAPDATVPGRFEERAAAVPEAAAVVSGGRRLTYRELDERANRVAHRLREHGAGPETLVAVALPRTCDLVVGLLGVLKAGSHDTRDGESIAPLARDMATAYAARLGTAAPDWPELPVQYVDYTLWQRELLGDENDPGGVLHAQAAYWRRELAGVPQPLRLPTDRPRPSAPSHRGDVVEFALPPHVAEAVERLAHDRGATAAMVLQSALAVLLGRLGGGEDITIGSPIANRTDDALADMVGFFVNTWVLRADLSGHPSFADVLGRVRDKALTAYDNQDAPFERLVELLNPERSTAYHPLFQVMFAWQNITRENFRMRGLEVAWEPSFTGTAKFDLFFNMGDIPGQGVIGHLEYATDLFDRGTVEDLAARFVHLVEQLVEAPERRIGLPGLLLPGEGERLDALAGPGSAAPDATVPGLVGAQAAARPEETAVVCGDRVLTYRELDERADRLARALRGRGVGAESLVGLALPRSADLVVAMLGILKSGAAYLPIDPRFPSARLGLMLEQARPRLLLADAESAAALPPHDVPVRARPPWTPSPPAPAVRSPPCTPTTRRT